LCAIISKSPLVETSFDCGRRFDRVYECIIDMEKQLINNIDLCILVNLVKNRRLRKRLEDGNYIDLAYFKQFE
jgi:hypothetical protein